MIFLIYNNYLNYLIKYDLDKLKYYQNYIITTRVIYIMKELKYIWGKAKKNSNGKRKILYHPLICHLTDVAAVAEIFWKKIFSEYLKSHLNDALFNDIQLTKRFLIFFSGIHDLGKATPIFQSKITELANRISKFTNLEVISTSNQPHNLLSGEILYHLLISGETDLNFINPDLIFKMKYLIGGHHGNFPRAMNFADLVPGYFGNEKWKQVQIQMINIIADFSGLNEYNKINLFSTPNDVKIERLNSILTLIAGFISVVDWIGSNDVFFDFYTPIQSFNDIAEFKKEYFQLSRARAKDAIEKIGWGNWRKEDNTKNIPSFKEIFAFKSLRPLQALIVDNLDAVSSPCLVIIEAPMGEGKTEAALYLEHYLERADNLQGAYIALPTQATSNQMFLRVRDFLSNTKKGLRVNLHLLHGNATISDEFALLKTKSKNFEDDESNIVADEWFTYRKRALISPFGVGTIDQILLSVLPIRHFFVKLFGLSGKTVIIDEVHSYDVYMSTILENLLYWLRLSGANVILLSATLPSYKRKKLVRTFYTKNNSFHDVQYPRITFCTKDEIKCMNFDVSLKKQKDQSVIIDWISRENLRKLLVEHLQQGGRATIICNKVKRAQELYLNLKNLEISELEIDLLHSRFPFIRRNEIENSVLEKFGKNKDHTKGAHLLISTQIIEQSLDLDFDLMISDLAPIDLLFQRMGRLHRHVRDNKGNPVIRPKKLQRPRFLIIKPNLNQHLIPQLSYPIYSRYILLKTFLNMWDVKEISIPDDLEDKIELVYMDETEIPSSFKHLKEHWEIELNRAKSIKEKSDRKRKLSAKYRLIPNPSDEDYFEDFSESLRDNQEAQEVLGSLTRITHPSINLICLYKNDSGDLFLDKERTISIDLDKKPDYDEAKKVLNYTVRVSNYRVFDYFSKTRKSIPDSWKENSLVRHIYYVILSKEDETNKYFFDLNNLRVYLSEELGIYIKNKEKSD
ncbi:MAG: CRISPR-associated helicase Cas3' [Candidatus Lokiarchaeota archaeon]|nr:CRISPR-associated helicase Cas3' [Candidatus Lokiarchaeota archaeon]